MARILLLCVWVWWSWPSAWALTPELARDLSVGDTDARIAALQRAVASPDEATVRLLKALADDAVKTQEGRVWIVQDGLGLDAVTGQTQPIPGRRWRS